MAIRTDVPITERTDEELIEQARLGGSGSIPLLHQLADRLERAINREAKVEAVGVTNKQPHELALHEFGVYRVEPPGYDQAAHRTSKGLGPVPHYCRYLRVPAGWVVEMEVPEFKYAGLRPTFVPDDHQAERLNEDTEQLVEGAQDTLMELRAAIDRAEKLLNTDA